MNEVTRLVERLSASLDSHVDPEVACVDIGSQLDALRKMYRLRPNEFSPDVIDGLKRVSRLNEEIRALPDLVEDAEVAQYREYAQETVNALVRIAQCFEGMQLGEFAKARVRELRERLPNLRSEQAARSSPLGQKRRAEAAERAAAAAKLIRRMAALAPQCPRCEVTMTLRSGRHGDFWGCYGYPECAGTQNLSPTAKSKLMSFRAESETRDDDSSDKF